VGPGTAARLHPPLVRPDEKYATTYLNYFPGNMR